MNIYDKVDICHIVPGENNVTVVSDFFLSL